MSARSALRRAVATTALAVLAALAPLLAWAPAPPAAAHDELLFSDPSEAGVLAALPSRAILTFTGPVAEVHEVSVTGPDGSVTNGAPTATGPEVRQNLWAGPDGTYTLTYDVVSSDGHEMAGEITFDVGGSASGEEGTGSSPPTDDDGSGSSLRGVVVPAGVVLLSGAFALALWHRRRTT
ncbi:copper resistance CopC family protein [Nocardioides sp. zg-1228]|uniref:copper resistance CopC family protein n=1 Tax=Nocardioides sp. zg-1228 TaxID=2763008 RepID=UPI00164346A3|nr:copper resistance CopC family protein [Nocardioides sp. zg-1228]MBC2933321.1 copper resistance protein CopC [Nocardioides sp. zg-1228]QSF56520.1 copper resistance protein CopC [Nocardioides sp. zg-1228]